MSFFSLDANLHNDIIKNLLEALEFWSSSYNSEESLDGSSDFGHVVEVFKKKCEDSLHDLLFVFTFQPRMLIFCVDYCKLYVIACNILCYSCS